MHGITEQFFKSERDPAGRAADSAGKVYKQWMLIVYFDFALFQLLRAPKAEFAAAMRQLHSP